MNNVQWKRENGSFNFSINPASTDRLDAKKLFSQRLPEKIGASEYEIFSLIFEEVITLLKLIDMPIAQQRNDNDFHVTRKEIDQFIRILFLSSVQLKLWTKY